MYDICKFVANFIKNIFCRQNKVSLSCVRLCMCCVILFCVCVLVDRLHFALSVRILISRTMGRRRDYEKDKGISFVFHTEIVTVW